MVCRVVRSFGHLSVMVGRMELGMDLIITNLVGFVASSFSFIMFVPQARAVWLNRKTPAALEGVSATGQWMLLGNATLWAIYAVLTGAFWVGAPGLVNAPLAIVVIILLRRSHNLEPSDDCGHPGTHMIFITAPPGYGTIVDCSPETARHGVPIPSESSSPSPAPEKRQLHASGPRV